MELPDLPAMHAEWTAWRDFCKELEKHLPGVELNAIEYDRLFKAVRRWGEHLSRLRVDQDVVVRMTAYNDAETEWNK